MCENMKRQSNEILEKAFAETLDSADPLSSYKKQFYLPEHLYYEANGLGPMSIRSEATMQRVISEWKNKLVAGWFDGEIPWFYYPEKLAAMEQTIVGAEEKELILNGTTTTNIHSLLAAFYLPKGQKRKILCDSQMFSTDQYAVESILKIKGFDPCTELVLGGGDELLLDEAHLIAQMNDEVALIFLPSVVHSTGQLLDMERLTKEAQNRGILIGFDLSHSAGIVPHALHDWGVDFAVWCSYKYLNGGLGCPASMFIHKKNFHIEPALCGWHGFVKSEQFKKLPHFVAEAGAGGWQHGSPLILNMAPLEGSLSMILEAGIDAIRKKSIDMTSYFIKLLHELMHDLQVQVVTPEDPQKRGGHVTIMHPASEEITEFLDSGSMITDERKQKVKEKQMCPATKNNLVRIAFSPLFMSYEDVRQTALNLFELLK